MTNDPFRAHAPIPFNFSENVVEYWKEFEQIRTPAQNGSKPEEFHFVKRFQIWSFSGPYFPVFGPQKLPIWTLFDAKSRDHSQIMEIF